MSKLFAALEKQRQSVVAAPATGTMDPAQADAEDQETTGAQAQAQAEDLRLPPMLIDSSMDFSREIALLYRSLSVVSQGAPGSILVCSAESGAGTTTIALNLAFYAAANEGRRTLYVDANLQNPFLSKVPGGKKTGFLDLLRDQGAVGNYASTSSASGLDVMSTGGILDSSDQLVSQHRIRYVLDQCREEYPFVVFDAAPINTSPGTIELAQAVEGVLMVERANALASGVERAKASLELAKANILGVVYNDF